MDFNRRRPVCPRDGSWEWSRLSQGRFLFVPETVPMFMFIGFFLPKIEFWTSAGESIPCVSKPCAADVSGEHGRGVSPDTVC